jgi:hypothetical protein
MHYSAGGKFWVLIKVTMIGGVWKNQILQNCAGL